MLGVAHGIPRRPTLSPAVPRVGAVQIEGLPRDARQLPRRRSGQFVIVVQQQAHELGDLVGQRDERISDLGDVSRQGRGGVTAHACRHELP